MSMIVCARCDSQSIVTDYDYGARRTYDKCAKCGHEKFKEVEDVLGDGAGKEEEKTVRSLPEKQIKQIEELTLLGASNGEINRETGAGLRTVGRYVTAYYEKTGQKRPEQRSGKKTYKRVDIKYGEEGTLERETVKTIEALIKSYQVEINQYQSKINTLTDVAKLLKDEAVRKTQPEEINQ